MSYVYRDADGTVIEVGDRVEIEGWRATSILTQEESLGKIVHITDPDGDTDDYGRQIGISPKVNVMFDDGIDDDFPFSYNEHSEDFWCFDIVKLP